MSELPMPTSDPMNRLLGRLKRGLHLWLWVDGLSRIIFWAVVIVFLDLGIDRYFRLDRAQRGVMLLIMLAVIVVIAYRRLVRPMMQPVSDDQLALQLERKEPTLGQALISALQFSRGEDPNRRRERVERVGQVASPELIEATVALGRSRASGMNPMPVLDRRQQLWNLLRGGGPLAVLIIAFVIAPQTMQLWLQRNLAVGEQTWPRMTQLAFNGAAQGELVAPRGDDVELIVRAGGVVPSSVFIDYRAQRGGRRTSQQMTRVGRDGYRFTVANVLEPLLIRARGGDGDTGWVKLNLVDRPEVASLKLTVEPPAYTGEAARDLAMGEGSYFILTGSTLRIQGQSTKRLQQATLQRGEEAPVELPLDEADDTQFAIEIKGEALQSGVWGIELLDQEPPSGLRSRRPTRFSIRVMADELPSVRAGLQGIGDLAINRALAPIECRVHDDFAIDKVQLAYRIDRPGEPTEGDQWIRRDLNELVGQLPSQRIDQHVHAFDLRDLTVEPGDHLTLRLEATDNDAITGPKVGTSSAFALRIVTEQELREELLRREQDQRMEFERLLREQELRVTETRAIQAELDRSPDAFTPAQRRVLSELEKQQRLAAGRAAAIADQLAQIVAEVTHNRLEDADGPIHRRLNQRIITPIRRLAQQALPEAADPIDLARRPALEAEERDSLLSQSIQQQNLILITMRDILEDMVKIEGYQQAINLLREVLKAQTEVNEQTIKELEKQIEDIFDD